MNLPTMDPVRRALTEAELTAIIGRIDAADSTAGLLAAVVSSVYDTLLAERGLTLTTLPDGHKIDPRQFHIPTSQWQAIAGAVTDRAAAWGTGPELAMELVNVLPSSYDDPAHRYQTRPAPTGAPTCCTCTSAGTRSTSSPPPPHTSRHSPPTTAPRRRST